MGKKRRRKHGAGRELDWDYLVKHHADELIAFGAELHELCKTVQDASTLAGAEGGC